LAEKQNLILIVCDTFRRDYLSCYGSPWVKTPHLDRLAAESVLFEGAFACSFPTLPCRAELATGKFVFPYLTWGPLPAGEVTLAECLSRSRYHTALISDNLPATRRNYGYDRGFQSRLHLRGQWYDEWADASIPVQLPVPENKLDQHDRVRQYLRNVSSRKREEEYFGPRVMLTAAEWLERFGHEGPFFLHVECFDPHEPWDPPDSYVDLARIGEHRIIYPNLGKSSYYSAEELAAIRELYAGEVRMVDRWIGHLLERIDALGLRDNTTIAFMSDHGVFLGEHGLLGKASKRREDVDGWPPYPEVSHIPLMIRQPGITPRREGAFVHPGDLMPTFLELAGVAPPPGVTASSLAPMLRGPVEQWRDVSITGWSYRGWRSWHPTYVRSNEWSMIWWRTGIPPRLHHLPSDPGETRDVYKEHPEAARWLHARLVEFLKQQTCPPKSYWSRRFFFSWSPPRSTGEPSPAQ